MRTIQAIAEHVRGCIDSPPESTLSAFPSLRAGPPLVCVDHSPGARPDLEVLAGRNRACEVNYLGATATPLAFGGPTPRAYNLDGVTVRVRYDVGPGAQRTASAALTDAMAICHAVHASQWTTVAGLQALSATPGPARKVTASDDAGRRYESIICEVHIRASFDIGV